MQEIFAFLLAVLALILGIPIGDILAKITQEELKTGKKWFLILIFLSLAGAGISLVLSKDDLMFSFLFIAIVTSRSLKITGKK